MGSPRCSSSRSSRHPSPGPVSCSSTSRRRGSTTATSTSARAGAPTRPRRRTRPASRVPGRSRRSATGSTASRRATASRGATPPGSYAEQVLVAADAAVTVPDGVATEVAAAVLLQGSTAHYLATSTYPIQSGDSVLVHAAAGGVGLLLTQIARRRGGRVIATTSTEAKAELARAAGAGETIGYEGFAERARELTGGEGVAAVYDGIGAATFDESLAALRPRGYMVIYGAASGQPPPVEIARLNAGSLFLTRPTLAHYGREGDELRMRAADLFALDRRGRARRAHRRALPARGRRARPGRPRLARHHGQADPHPLGFLTLALWCCCGRSSPSSWPRSSRSGFSAAWPTGGAAQSWLIAALTPTIGGRDGVGRGAPGRPPGAAARRAQHPPPHPPPRDRLRASSCRSPGCARSPSPSFRRRRCWSRSRWRRWWGWTSPSSSR